MRASEESLTECRDGCSGKDSHESIVDHLKLADPP